MKYIEILILTETKLDETFLTSQFLMDGFSKPYRFDRNKYGGRVMIIFGTLFQVRFSQTMLNVSL